MLNINEPQHKRGIVILQLGFRPFFLGATIFSIVTMILWMGNYHFSWQTTPYEIATTTWHAHEMLFGYLMPVIAGFLLTAVKNWTGQQTLNGPKLLTLLALWALARILPLFNIGSVEIIAVLDNLFLAGLMISVSAPVFRVKQWAQSGVLLLLILMLSANLVYYAGLFGIIKNGVTLGLYSGLHLIMLLVFVMARRVIPFFIERGVEAKVSLCNRKWLDVSSLVLFILLWITDIALSHAPSTATIAAILFALHAIRLVDWHTRLLWKSPMLWILYLGYSFLVLGFALKSASIVFSISPFLSVHAFTVGGISVLTLGMMTRVSLGHTGRDVKQPPSGIPLAFIILLTGAVVRVLFPLFAPDYYGVWIGISQLCWIIAFTLFFILFLPILTAPRIDGQPG